MIADDFLHLSKYCQGTGVEFGEDDGHISSGLQVRNSRRQIPDVTVCVSNPEAVKVEPLSQDFVACIHYLEHYGSPQGILTYWWSLLKTGGNLVIILPEAGRYPRIGQPGCNQDHRVDYNLNTFIMMLAGYGFAFEVVEKGFVESSFFVVLKKGKEAEVVDDCTTQEIVSQTSVASISPVQCQYSVVIPFYNHTVTTQKCVERLFEVAQPDEVILVDDGSTYRYPKDDRVRIVRFNRNSGFPMAVNRGVSEARHEFVVLLNNDVLVYHGCVEKMLNALRNPSLAIVGQGGGKLDADYVYVGQDASNPDYIEMFCCAFRKSMWERVGPLDTDFGRGYCEDSDWGIRARRMGFKLLAIPGLCKHEESKTFGKGDEIKAHIERNRQKLIAKHYRGRALWVMDSLGCNGGSKVVQKLAGAMLDAGWQVDVCSFTDWSTAAKGWERFGHKTTADVDAKYDVVFSTFHSTMPFVAGVRCQHKIALIQSDEPEWGPDPVAKNNFMLPGFRHIIIADHMQAFKQKYGMKIIGQIDNGVDNITFTPKWVFDKAWPHSLMLIRKSCPVWYDGQKYAEEAVAELAKRYPDLSVTVLGGTKPNWKCNINHVRTYDEDEICDLYNGVSCMVVPSLIEGSSLVPLEAMASGCPVVSTEVGMHYATDDLNYLRIPYQDSGAIVEAVSLVFDDEVLRWQLYREGLRLAHNRTWEREQQQFMDILTKEFKG